MAGRHGLTLYNLAGRHGLTLYNLQYVLPATSPCRRRELQGGVRAGSCTPPVRSWGAERAWLISAAASRRPVSESVGISRHRDLTVFGGGHKRWLAGARLASAGWKSKLGRAWSSAAADDGGCLGSLFQVPLKPPLGLSLLNVRSTVDAKRAEVQRIERGSQGLVNASAAVQTRILLSAAPERHWLVKGDRHCGDCGPQWQRQPRRRRK